MISNEDKIDCLNNILKSKSFANSPSSSALLKYLFDKSIEGTFLKEGIIDLEFYGENKDPDKSKPRVRANVYNLRKKLDDFYKNEGRNAIWKLIIDKGQYNVRFEKPGSKQNSFSDKSKIFIPYFLAFILLILLIIKTLPSPKPLLWKDFFDNHKTTTLFLGDAFGVITQTYMGKPGWLNDFRLHNLDDFYQYIKENPELKDSILPADFTYINEEGAVAAKYLQQLFSKFNRTFDIRLTSKAEFREMTDRNLVYVGVPVKKNIASLFNESNPYCQLDGYDLHIKGNSSINDTLINIHTKYTQPYDYALVARASGANKTERFFFFAKQEIGNMWTIKHFTNPDFTRKFAKEKLGGKNNFIALFKVYGKERVDIRMQEIWVLPF